jgi:CubicO group peptidase (beta-lactamase class C family)
MKRTSSLSRFPRIQVWALALLLTYSLIGINAHLSVIAASTIGADSARQELKSTNVIEERIRRVENGLLPAVVIKDQPNSEMKITDRMRHYKTPGVSVAVINDGKIEWARGYGVLEVEGKIPVTPETMFQAGSISKPVSAMAALRLVQEGKLALDENVNQRLVSWKVPDNEFTRDKKVTLRGLLTHSAGLNVSGFDGYASGEKLPTLLQVLNGEKPANSAPIRVGYTPGSQERYSGGGFSIMHQLMIDVAGKSFAELMKESVLARIGMKQSTFEVPLPSYRQANAARGHLQNGQLLPGQWHAYPEMAAAALWSTPSDLARLIIELQQSLRGRSNKVLSREMTHEMVSRQIGDSGLGVYLKGQPQPFRFSHNGSTEGYNCIMVGFMNAGQGAVVMTNSDNGSELTSEILRSIAREYGWDDLRPEVRTLAKVNPQTYESYVGQYEFSPGSGFTVTSENGKIFGQPQGRGRVELFPESETTYFMMIQGTTIKFIKDEKGQTIEMVLRRGARESKARRISKT